MKFTINHSEISHEKLGTEPVDKLLLSMALPSVVAMLMQALYNSVDSMFVARISSESLAAVTLAFPVTMIIGAMSTGIGVGINSSISRSLGADDVESAGKAAANGIMLGFGAVAVMIAFGLLGTDWYLRLYTDDQEVIAAGVTYIRTVSVLAFGNIFTQISFSILQGSGNMTFPMISQLVGGACVMALDPLFIFGLGMGVLGAAVASSLSQAISMSIGMYGIFVRNKDNLPVTFKGFRPDAAILKDILAVGVPSALTQATTSVVSGIISKLIAGYGTAAISVYGGYSRFSSFGILPVFGVTRGMNPILGYSFGAKNKERFKATEKLAVKAGFVITSITALVFLLGPDIILRLISATPEMIEVGRPAYRILALPLFVSGAAIVMSQAFPPAKRSYLTMIYTLLRQVGIMIPLCLFCGRKWGMTGIWIGCAATDYLGLIVVIIMTIWFIRNVINKLGEEQ